MLASDILELAAIAFGTEYRQAASACRWTECVRARQATIWVLRTRRDPATTFAGIARVMRRDPQTVRHAYHQAKILRANSARFRSVTDELLSLSVQREAA